MKHQRKRTQPKDIAYGLHLYFPGLSYRSTAKALGRFIHRSRVSVWKWMQRYKPQKVSSKRKKVDGFITDETQIKVGSQYVWLWVAIEPKKRQILRFDTSFERNMLVAERFIASLLDSYGRHPVSTDGGGTWYPQACKFLKAEHHAHSPFEKSVIERTIQHVKDRIEGFDGYFPCKKDNCRLKHVKQWLGLFIYQHNKETVC